MKIIGLTGVAGAGKDAVGQMILDNKSGYVRAIADPLKAAVLHVFGDGDVFEAAREVFALTEAQVRGLDAMGVEIPFWGASGGALVERLGACLEKTFGSDIWERASEQLLTRRMLTDRLMKEAVIPEWGGREWGLSPRQVMQRFGDAVRGEFGADVLLKRAEIDLSVVQLVDASHEVGSDVVVYTDIRTDIEAQWVRERGGVVIQVIRASAEPVSAHVTEQGVSYSLLSGWVHNEGGLSDLRYHVGRNLADWLGGAVDIEYALRQRAGGAVRPLCREGWITRVARQLCVDVEGMTDKQALSLAKGALAELYDGRYYVPEAAAEVLGGRWAEQLQAVA